MRRLRLRAEALSTLTTDELHAMVAGDTTTLVETRPVHSCLIRCVLDTRLPNCSRICIKP